MAKQWVVLLEIFTQQKCQWMNAHFTSERRPHQWVDASVTSGCMPMSLVSECLSHQWVDDHVTSRWMTNWVGTYLKKAISLLLLHSLKIFPQTNPQCMVHHNKCNFSWTHPFLDASPSLKTIYKILRRKSEIGRVCKQTIDRTRINVHLTSMWDL